MEFKKYRAGIWKRFWLGYFAQVDDKN